MTKLQLRAKIVRDRLNSVIRRLPEPERKGKVGQGSLTKYGVFTRELVRISAERGLPVTKKGPDQYSHSLKNFALGKQLVSFDRLDSIEMTCIYFEQKFAEEREARKTASRYAPEPSPVDSIGAALAFDREYPEQPPVEVPEPFNGHDPELAAMQQIVEALEPLEKVQRERILNWAEARFTIFG